MCENEVESPDRVCVQCFQRLTQIPSYGFIPADKERERGQLLYKHDYFMPSMDTVALMGPPIEIRGRQWTQGAK